MNILAVASQVSLRASSYIEKEQGLEMEGLKISRQKLKISDQCGASPEIILDFLENEQKIDEYRVESQLFYPYCQKPKISKKLVPNHIL